MQGRVHAITRAGALVLLFAAMAHAGNTAQAGNIDDQQLQGKWIVKSFEYNGAEVDRLKDAVREFSDSKYTLTPKSGDAIEGSVTLDESKSPKTIDLDVNGRILKGIYQLDGDTLKLCYNLSSEDRPTEFVSKPDSGLIVVVHSREK
ncbi:MAG: TIGR03067 domain-containing protein [Pirellulales bacterium]